MSTGRTRRSSVRGSGIKGAGKTSLLAAFEGICGAIARSFGSETRSQARLESLESRQLLDATIVPNQFSLLNSTTNGGGVVYLANESAGVTDIKITTTDNGVSAGNDRLDSIVVDLAATAPAAGYSVKIQLANLAGSTPTITFVGGAADSRVYLYVYNSAVTDAAGGGFGQLSGLAGTATTAVVDSHATPAPAMTDGVVLAGAGNIGNVTATSVTTNRGGDIVLDAGAGTVGNLTLGNVNLSGTASDLTINSGGQADLGQVTLGTVTIGTQNVTIGNVAKAIAGVSVGAITNNSTTGNSFNVNASAIAGSVSVASYTLTNTTSGTPQFNNGNFVVTDAGNLGGFSVGAVTLGDADEFDAGSFIVNVGGTSGAVSTGAITSNAGDFRYTGDTTATGKATASVSIGNVTLNRGGGFLLNTGLLAADNITGALAVGNITITAGGSFTLQTGGNVGGATTIGNVTAQGAGQQTGDTNFYIGGTAAAVTVGNITLGDAGQNDNSDFFFYTGIVTADSGMGALQVGNVQLASNGGSGAIDVAIDTNGKGSFGTVSLGNIAISGNGSNTVSVGHEVFGAAGPSLGAITLRGIDLMGPGSVSIRGQQMTGNIDISGQWNLGGSGGVTIELQDPAHVGATSNGKFGNIGGDNWDINFLDGATGGITLNSADGAGTLTIGSVDHANPAGGFIHVDVNTDLANEDGSADNVRTGSIGNIAIKRDGDNSYTLQGGTAQQVVDRFSWKNVEWGNNSQVLALSGGNVAIAGGAQGAFYATNFGNQPVANIGGTGSWGTFTLGGQSNGLWIQADDGIGAITIGGPSDAAQTVAGSANTLFSIAQNVTINGNADAGSEHGVANVQGSVGNISVFGSTSAVGPSLSGNISGVSVGNIDLLAGDLNVNVQAGQTIVDSADRIALNATGPKQTNIGNVTVALGSITGGQLVAGSNIGNISAKAGINLGLVRSDTAANDGAAFNGAVGTIDSSGNLYIGTLQTRVVANTDYHSTQSVGAITADGSIRIDNAFIGGDMLTVTATPVRASDAGWIFLPNLDINGSVTSITSGLRPQDGVTADGIIRGHIYGVNAGQAVANVDLHVLAADRASATAPIFVITQGNGTPDSGTDYIFMLAGTWNAGTTAGNTTAKADISISFSGGTNGSNSVRINDFFGVTSDSDSVLSLATRADAVGAGNDYSAGLGVKNSPALFSLAGFQETYGGPLHQDKGRSDFKGINIEGNLLGSLGGPGNILPTANATEVLASNAPILGHIANLEIGGIWVNPAVDLPAPQSAQIFVEQIEEISFQNVANPKGGGAFSYIAPNAAFPASIGVTGNAVAGPGIWVDLNVFKALTPLAGSQTIDLPIGSGVTKMFVGPTDQFEAIRFTNGDPGNGVVNSAQITLAGGVISNINLYGQAIGILFNTIDPANPATNSSTTINYDGTTTFQPNLPGSNGDNKVIDYLFFSSSIGDVTVVDSNAADGVATNVGPIVVGYGIDITDPAFNPTVGYYLNNPNIAGENATIRFAGATPAPVYGSVGNISVDGSLGLVATSGGAGSITTVQKAPVATGAVPTSNFVGLVTDGSVGAINIQGSVSGSLAVGDPTVVGGTVLAPVVGINGTPGFTGNITVAVDLGSASSPIGTGFVDSTTSGIQAPVASWFSGVIQSTATQAGILTNIADAYAGDQVSAPFGISLGANPIVITVGRDTFASIVSGKGILVTGVKGANDGINMELTSGDILGNVWSGDGISGFIHAIGFAGDIDNHPGVISNLTILAAGDITAPITATDDFINVRIQAGTGLGGSLLANVIAGLSGTGGFYGSNYIIADNNVGTPEFTTVISAADDVNFEAIMAGQMPLIHIPVGTTPSGDINSDIIAGTQPVGATLPLPVTTNINDEAMPILSNQDDSIDIELLQAGLGGTANAYNLNGTLEAAGSIYIHDLMIDGNAVGNDGQPGGHLAAAGVGYMASFYDPNELDIYDGTITGTLSGKLSSGMFVPFNDAGPSPLNANDLGQLQAGTVLTLGAVDVDLTVGRWVDTPIALKDILSGAVSTANASYIPQFSVGATHDVYVDIYAQGQPFAAPQSGPGTVTPNPADGDIVGVSIAAFGELEGYVEAADSINMTLAMSNIDAVTALDTQAGWIPGNPSNPSTNLPLNDGVGAWDIGIDNNLNITADGHDVGGLNIGFFTAGLDMFTEMNTGGAVPAAAVKPATSLATAPFNGDTFWTSWGMGNIGAYEYDPGEDAAPLAAAWGNASLSALDADPTDGLEAGKLTFAMIAAGQDNYADIEASDDITAITDDATTDGTLGFSTQAGLNADIAAGLSANRNLDPTVQSDLFPGGNLGTYIVAGGAIAHLATGEETNLVGIVAKGGNDGVDAGNGTGWITDEFALVSGAEDQIPDQNNASASATPSDIHALVIASSSIDYDAVIDAGDVYGWYGGIGGVTYSSGIPNGSFFGGVIAGAGVDLNINDAADNDVTGDMNATIRTVNNLDVTGYGILAENDMEGAHIQVGFGLGGGNLLGNVVAEGDINDIQVWGNVGAAGSDSVLYTAGVIENLIIGDPAFRSGDGVLRPASQYIGSFGTLYSDVFEGGNGDHTAMVSIGGGIAEGAVLAIGALNGVQNADIDLGAGHALYSSDYGLFGLFLTAGSLSDNDPADPSAGDVNIVLVGDGWNDADLSVTGSGNAVSINTLISGANLDDLFVEDGSVGQIIVNNDLNISEIVYGADGYLADLNVPVADFAGTFPFLANSIPTTSNLVAGFNNDHEMVDLGDVEVDGNIGDIEVQGEIYGTLDSETGSVGNITANDVSSMEIYAQNNIGNIYAATGGFTEDGYLVAYTGSIGVLNVQGDIDISEGRDRFVAQDIGGLVSRNGMIADLDDDDDGEIFVHGSIGPIVASDDIKGSFTAETGNIGKPVNEGDAATPQTGVYSDVGDITVNLAAGNCIGDITAALGSIIGDVTKSQFLITLNGVDIESVLDAEVEIGGDSFAGFELEVNLHDITASGTLGINVNSQTFIRAGGDIGKLTAYRDIGFYNITAGASVKGLFTTVGSVGAAVPLTLALGGLSAGIAVGDLKVTANDSIGWDCAAIDSAKDIGAASPIDLTFNGLRIAVSPAAVDLHAVTGNIGNIIGRQGIAVLHATAGGAIGDVKAMTGDIGSEQYPVVLRANGGVEIDPLTLEYVAQPENGTAGIGNVFAYLGDIFIDLNTAGDVGIAAGPGEATGGIAAPLGSITGTVKVGGDLGGLSARSTDVNLVVLGMTGVMRDPSGGQSTVSDGSPLKFTVGGVLYSVQTNNATAVVNYTVTDDQVVFDSIDVSATDGAAGVWVLTSAVTSGPIDGSTSSAQVEVKSLTVSGDASDIVVDGKVDSLVVNGNLDGGELKVEGGIDNATIAGDIGHEGNEDGNAFLADGMQISVTKGIKSLAVGGTNFGRVTVDIGQVLDHGKVGFISWANPNSTSADDQFITATLKKGTAQLVINNGVLETVTFNGKSASSFGVVTADTSFGAATDGTVTPAGKSNSPDQKALAAELKRGAQRGSAEVGSITAATSGKFSLNGAVIEGKLDTLAFAGSGSTLKNLGVGGDVGSILVAGSINGVNILGNVGTINGGTSLQNVQVRGNADVLVASNTVKNVNVTGNAGVIRSGKTMTNVNVGGSAISISAQNANKVSVAGSVGVETSGVLTGSDLSLGSAFSSADVARISGTTEAGLNTNGNPGANGTSYIGGFFVGTGNNIAIGGPISDLEALALNKGKWTMLGQVVDDAQVGRGNFAYTKVNGVVTQSPAQKTK